MQPLAFNASSSLESNTAWGDVFSPSNRCIESLNENYDTPDITWHVMSGVIFQLLSGQETLKRLYRCVHLYWTGTVCMLDTYSELVLITMSVKRTIMDVRDRLQCVLLEICLL